MLRLDSVRRMVSAQKSKELDALLESDSTSVVIITRCTLALPRKFKSSLDGSKVKAGWL